MDIPKEDRMVRVYRHRDKKANHTPPDFDKYWLLENITSKPCAYCGSTKEVGSDRIDNTQGHTKANIVPCCNTCNRIRINYFSSEDFRKVVAFCKENNLGPY